MALRSGNAKKPLVNKPVQKSTQSTAKPTGVVNKKVVVKVGPRKEKIVPKKKISLYDYLYSTKDNTTIIFSDIILEAKDNIENLIYSASDMSCGVIEVDNVADSFDSAYNEIFGNLQFIVDASKVKVVILFEVFKAFSTVFPNSSSSHLFSGSEEKGAFLLVSVTESVDTTLLQNMLECAHSNTSFVKNPNSSNKIILIVFTKEDIITKIEALRKALKDTIIEITP
jgi:hypothetical protein